MSQRPSLRRAIPTALALALGACVAPPALDERPAPVVGATLATDDPGVVALLTSSGRVFCTGTLVAPSIILTAAHCIAEAGGDPAVAAFFGNDVLDVGTRVGVTRYATHPGWTGDLAGGHDLAVLLLAAPQPEALIVPMNTVDLATHIDAPYRVVGFGIHDRVTRELDGKKRTGAMKIGGLTGDYLEAVDVDADGATAVCQGDSGGPGFLTLDGVEVVAGVHSYSFGNCFNPSGDARPDLYLASFLQPWIDANDPTCGADNRCVRRGCSADPDCEPCGPDGTCATGACALPDLDCATSGLGEICQADTQCVSGDCIAWSGDAHSQYCTQPCAGPADCPAPGMSCDGTRCVYQGEPPGAIGQACDAATDCSAYVCDEGICTYACNVPRGMLCPDGYACANHDGEHYRCYPVPPTDDGGCCGTAPAPGASLGAALAVLAVLGRRRRSGYRCTMRRLAVLGSAVAAALCAGPGAASANGRFPTSVSINFRPGNTQDLYLGATFGFLISHDDNRFRWLCEKNVGYEGTFDPKYRVAADGTIYATTFRGLRVSRDGGCSFLTATADLPASHPGYINNVWVDAIDVGPNGDVWVATAESARPNDIFRSTDGARTFQPTGNQSMQIWWKSLAVARTDANRVYATGYQVTQIGEDGGQIPPTVHLRRTDDAGGEWQHLSIAPFQLGSSPMLLVEAVSPTDADVVFVRSLRADPPAGDKLYRSLDGGLTFAEVLTTTDAIRNVVARANGDVLVATVMGGLHRSTDGGATFQPVPAPPQTACLGDRGDQLFACGANWEPDLFSLGRSPDGATWSKVFRFVEMAGPLACPAGTVQHDQCEAVEWPAIREMFGVPAAMDAGIDAPTNGPTSPGGCCDASAGAPPTLALGGAVAMLVTRRRRKTCCG